MTDWTDLPSFQRPLHAESQRINRHPCHTVETPQEPLPIGIPMKLPDAPIRERSCKVERAGREWQIGRVGDLFAEQVAPSFF
jgi:hypothetical protein